MNKNSTNPSLCIFANFFIETEERFIRMKDSFNSFRNSNPKEWRINIRGKYKDLAGNFLKRELGQNLLLNYIDSNMGWFHDSYSFMKDVKCDYIFFWIEDHICINNPSTINEILLEMKSLNVEVLLYSWFNYKTLKIFNLLPLIYEGSHIKVTKIDKITTNNFSNAILKDHYAISALSIYSREFFFKVLLSKKPFLKRWPKHLPFNFEKKIKDRISESFHYAIPKKELFAVIDEGTDIPGYSLISRGMYPDRLSRSDLKKIEFATSISKWQKLRRKYLPNIILIPLRKLNSLRRRIIFTLDY